MNLHIERRLVTVVVCDECGCQLLLSAEEPTIASLMRRGWLFHYHLDDPSQPWTSAFWFCCAECALAEYVPVEGP